MVDSGIASQSKSLRVASDDEVEQPLEVVGAVEGDPHDAAIVPECLDADVGLQVLAKLLLDPPYGWIGAGRR